MSFILKQIRKLNSSDFFKKPVGLENGRLLKCPSTPNCVCSEEERAFWSIQPLRVKSEDSLQQLSKLIQTEMGGRLVTQNPNYLHAEFQSQLLGFVDDLELHQPDGSKVIHVRSASRMGKSDLGVNRQRVEKLRGLWEK